SMRGCYFSSVKLDMAKNTVTNMMVSLPPAIKLNAGLRSFGPAADSNVFAPYSRLVIPVDTLDRGAISTAVKGFRAGGLTPIAVPVTAANDDLSDVKGRIAVILISDGIDNGSSGDTMAAVQALREKYIGRICISTISVGEDAQGKKLLGDIVADGGCGLASSAVTLESGELMADFVKRVFYERNYLRDSDRDGVLESQDKCPGTPIGIVVDVEGCPLDTDNDGVYDYLDQCPDTPEGTLVDSNGCPPQVSAVDVDVEFDTDKYNVKVDYMALLSDFADFMEANPQATAVLEGHTDSVGSARYNMGLSIRRAKSVKRYLIDNFQIADERLAVEGYGLTRPIASNATADGRQKNRRAVAVVNNGPEY
ncbi:MAG: OmpA family protein, partial [Desulfobulbaceae bacterium]|nr:OmpA family protein [Desulfobulbaceae bacterium]